MVIPIWVIGDKASLMAMVNFSTQIMERNMLVVFAKVTDPDLGLFTIPTIRPLWAISKFVLTFTQSKFADFH